MTGVFDEGADREAAFRFVENGDVPASEIALAAHVATARRARGQAFVYVPVDGSSLNLTDRTGEKDFGVVGARSVGAKGLIVMSAIAVGGDGTPLGLCGQEFWARRKRSTRKSEKKDRRPLKDKETRYWLQVIEHAQQVFAAHAPDTIPWFQLDRGGDAWPVLLDAAQRSRRITIRATHDRRLLRPDGEKRRLWEEVESQPVEAIYELPIPRGKTRKERTAHLGVRYCRVELDLRDLRTKEHHEVEFFAVLVCEEETTPTGEEPLEWMLLTTYPVKTAHDALLVLAGYAQRWRIEEFHKVWKTGACRVEDAQLRAEDHVVRWATILASVGMRLLRLTYLARRTPEAPATVELSKAEVEAVLVLKNPKRKTRGMPTIGEAVRWIADLGGYTGKSSGGPPGALVIARGLRRVEPLAFAIGAGRVKPAKMAVKL